MILENLRLLARAMIPGSGSDAAGPIKNTFLDLILNKGVEDIAAYTVCLSTNKKFSAAASQGDIANPYIISTVITDFLVMGKGGLWWNQGTVASPDYKRLNPKTIAALDKDRPNWRDVSDGAPQDYLIDGNNIIVIPAPVSALTDGFWLFYGAKPTYMTAVGHYPFSGSTTEYTYLSMFDMAIIKYARHQISPVFNQQTNENISWQEYLKEREEKTQLLRRRPDISNVAQFQGKL